MLETMPGLRNQGRQRKQWIDDLTEWSNKSIPELVQMAQDSWCEKYFDVAIRKAIDVTQQCDRHMDGRKDSKLSYHRDSASRRQLRRSSS